MSDSPSGFHQTHWTLVLRSRGKDEEAKAALSDLCAAYYKPVISFLRRQGQSDDAAREIAHAFFESILTGGLGTPDPSRGRFRSYLLGALKNFLSKRRDAALAGKRGGGVEHVPLVTETDTAPGLPIPGIEDDALCFDREWAHTLIGRALNNLEQENSHKPEYFAALKPFLAVGTEIPQSEVARILNTSEASVKVAIHRLRNRFRELIRFEVALTVNNDPAEVAEELKHLVAVIVQAAS